MSSTSDEMAQAFCGIDPWELRRGEIDDPLDPGEDEVILGSRNNPIDLTGDDETEPNGDAVIIPRTFPRFPMLSAELRCNIWQFAFPGPRFIHIRTENVDDDAPEDWDKINLAFGETGRPEASPSGPKAYVGEYQSLASQEYWWPQCSEKVPVLYFVCHEARAEVCKAYKPLIGNKPGEPVVFCDFSKDYLGLDTCQLFSRGCFLLFKHWLPLEIRDKPRRVVMSEFDVADLEGYAEGGYAFPGQLRLDELAIITHIQTQGVNGEANIYGFNEFSNDLEVAYDESGDHILQLADASTIDQSATQEQLRDGIESNFAIFRTNSSPGWAPLPLHVVQFGRDLRDRAGPSSLLIVVRDLQPSLFEDARSFMSLDRT